MEETNWALQLGKLKTMKNVTKYFAVIFASLQTICLIVEEAIDLHYSLPLKTYPAKFRLSLFLIISNGILYILVVMLILFNSIFGLLLGGIAYLILGIIVFLYALIEKNSAKALEIRPASYTPELQKTVAGLYYSSGVCLLCSSIFIFLFVYSLNKEENIKKEERNNLLEKQFDSAEIIDQQHNKINRIFPGPVIPSIATN